MKYKPGDVIEVRSSSYNVEAIGIEYKGDSEYESKVESYYEIAEPLFRKHHRVFTILGYSESGKAYFFKELGNGYIFPESFIKGLYVEDPVKDRFEILDFG